MGDLGRRRTVGQHALHQLADLATQGHEVFHPGRVANGPGQVHQVDALQENRSRSDTTPHRRWSLTRQTWAMCRSVMAMAASKALWSGERKTVPGSCVRQWPGKIPGPIRHHVPQVAQGEDPHRGFLFIHHHDAAHLLVVHQLHGFAQRRVRAATDRMAHRQFTQPRVEGVLGTQGLCGLCWTCWLTWSSRLLTTQGEVAKRAGQGKQLDEGLLVQLQAERVLAGPVFGARGPFAQQRGEGKHSPVVISKVVSVPPLAECGRSPITRPCLTM